jgi:hypothetical protein
VPGKCAYCERYCRIREAAHIFARGIGSGGRLDIPINLVSLGSTPNFACSCHTMSHNGKQPMRADLLVIVADRERCTVADIVDAVNFLRRASKDWSNAVAVERAGELGAGVVELVKKSLEYRT